MLQRFIDAANQNLWVFGLVQCGLFLIAVLILALDNRDRKNMRKKIRQLEETVEQLEETVETKERLLVHKDAEIKQLKIDLFRAREDGKREIHKRDMRIQQLELDKKQLSKWGAEK